MWLDKVQKMTQLSLTRGYVSNNNNCKSSNFSLSGIHQQLPFFFLLFIFFPVGKPEYFIYSY